jgi:hypothetical protein
MRNSSFIQVFGWLMLALCGFSAVIVLFTAVLRSIATFQARAQKTIRSLSSLLKRLPELGDRAGGSTRHGPTRFGQYRCFTRSRPPTATLGL